MCSAHVCSDNDFDIGGWELYGEDWHFFYDCMLSPAAQQVHENYLIVRPYTGTPSRWRWCQTLGPTKLVFMEFKNKHAVIPF